MSESHDEIARAVDRAARSVQGVQDVYSARPLVARAAKRLIDDGDEPLVLVKRQNDVLEVTVSVAIAAESAAASSVAAAVAEAVRTVVDPLGASEGSGTPRARVRVRVSRVLAAPGRGALEQGAVSVAEGA